MNIKPMNEYLLVETEDNDEVKGVYLGENKNKPKTATILAFSEKCENKFEVGKKVLINRYEMIPYNESDTQFFVSEKAIVGMY